MSNRSINNIVVAIQSFEDAKAILGKAALLSDADTRVHVVRVVYESLADLSSKHVDGSTELKRFVLEAEEPQLVEAIDASGADIPNIESATLWNSHVWEGINHTAENTSADLILKHVDDKDSIFRLQTPDDWNLLRHSTVPVMLTKGQPWPGKPKVLAALDVYDQRHEEMNQRVLENAQWLCDKTNAELHIASVFPMLANWMDNVTTTGSYERLRNEIEKEITDNVTSACQAQGIGTYQVHALEGLADLEINKLVSSVGADVLVLGTKARSGVGALVLGNTAEKILHKATADVLTVP